MKVMKVKWYGGTRRDGTVNTFGYIRDAQGQEHRIKQTMLDGVLLEKAPKENQYIVLTEAKKVKHLQDVAEAEYGELLELATTEDFFNGLWRALNMDDIDKDSLYAMLKTTKNALLHARIQHTLWQKFSHDEKREIIVSIERNVASYMVEDVLRGEVAFDARIEAIIRPMLEQQAYTTTYAVVNDYPTMMPLVKLDAASIVQALRDERFAEHAVTQLDCSFPHVASYIRRAPLYEQLQYKVRHIAITDWFSIPILHQTIQQQSDYMQFLNMYIHYELQQGHVQESMTYLLHYLQQHDVTIKKGDELPLQIVTHEAIQPFVDLPYLFELYNAQFDATKVFDVLQRMTEEQQRQYVPTLHATIKSDRRFNCFDHFLQPLERAEKCYEQLPAHFYEVFTAQPPLVKNYLIYMLAKHYRDKPSHWLTSKLIADVGKVEQHDIIKVLLRLLYIGVSGATSSDGDRIVAKIETAILTQLNNDEPLDTLALFPRCSYEKLYCEVKKITYYRDSGHNDEVLYCPIMRSSCDAITCQGPRYMGAHLGAIPTLPIEEWGIQELCAFAKIEPFQDMFFEQKNHGHSETYYTNRLAGWLNRVLELRDRMKCSKPDCQKAFKVKYDFSKRFEVAYNATHFSCVDAETEAGHDEHVYLSHCRCCRKLIDSRESRFKVSNTTEGIFICIHCGGAEKDIYYPIGQTEKMYTQGDICPKCNDRDEPMQQKYGGKWYSCKKCSHEIKTST